MSPVLLILVAAIVVFILGVVLGWSSLIVFPALVVGFIAVGWTAVMGA